MLESILGSSRIGGIVAHDPGGAEIVASFVRKLPYRPLLVLKGPARQVFERKLGQIATLELPALFEALRPGESILTGTSLASNLEREAIALARARGVKSAAFLDHWINYPLRFGSTEEWKALLPDEIWVGDELSYQVALKAGFPAERLRNVENIHLGEVRADILGRLQSGAKPSRATMPARRVLLLSEPISLLSQKVFGCLDGYGFTEHTLAESVAEVVAKQQHPSFEQLRIRPHPKENPADYERIVSALNHPRVLLSSEPDYIEEILWADAVIAIESMGLVFALMGNRHAISYIPSPSYECHLPHPQLVRTGDLPSLLGALGYA